MPPATAESQPSNDIFLPFGAQYYRAPTPLAKDWQADLDRFQQAGFNTLKYWAQWRWNNPAEGSYLFDDLDRLMDLAAERGLRVIINTLFDNAPAWLYKKSYDCRMVTSDGRRLGPVAHACRQIGGSPGPCLNHPEARQYRIEFLQATVERYTAHPALYVWDTWNEPELTTAIARPATQDNLVCYCTHCERLFKEWLEARYGNLATVNKRWGRNYQSFDELEIPVNPNTYADMLDWRQFQVNTITSEQRLRYEVTKAIDTTHPVMCHTVPMPIFNPVTCASDEWALSEYSDWAGNSVGTEPFAADLCISASGGGRDDPTQRKVAINAEIHALGGTSLARPKPLTMEDCKHYIFTPLAHGIRGFLFWQYRPELLGAESPAWGMTKPDGSPTPWMEHFAKLNTVLQQDKGFYWNAEPEGPQVGLLYSPVNHIFAWCAQGSFDIHDNAVQGAYRALYEANFRVRYVHPMDIARGNLDGLQTIFYPFPYVLDQPTADVLRSWVEAGGTLIGEAFFGNYVFETGLHSTTVPGFGMHEVFGAREGIPEPFSGPANVYEDAQGFEVSNRGPTIVTRADLPGLDAGHRAVGYLIRVPLETSGAEVVADFDDGSPAITIHDCGQGRAILVGTLLSAAANQGADARALLQALAAKGDIRPRPTVHTNQPVRVDTLRCEEDRAVIVRNLAEERVETTFTSPVLIPSDTLEEVVDGERLTWNGQGWPVTLEPGAVAMYRVRKT